MKSYTILLFLIMVFFTVFFSFGFGRMYEQKHLKCGPAQCMKYQIQGEMSCIQHRGE